MIMCCNVLENDENFLENVWFSDEAHFLLSGHVNSKNNIFWGSKVPEEVLQRPLHSVKCTANEMVDIWNTSWESHKLTKN